MRAIAVAFLVLVASLVLLATPAAARPFPETGYSITNDKIQDYFDHRGGVRVFGYPISREFYFMGTRVQFFQRAVLQLQSDDSVGLLNLLSDDMLPYTRINGSTFPAAVSAMAAMAPAGNDPSFAAGALDFVRAFAPDEWEGMKTSFYTTFLNTVTYRDAFPNGGGDPGLLPLINLEIWGLPTSKPTYDANNGNFVYVRFQRGIMHYDKTSGVTQGVLLGDYLKSVITGQNLPIDLDQQAQGSKLYRQYDNTRPGGMVRPWDVPGTNLFGAFEKDGVVLPPPASAVAAPPTAVPAATPVPAAPAAAPVQQPPASIALVGPPQFTNVIGWALDLLAAKTPDSYALVRQNVYKIQLVDSSNGSIDPVSRTINFNEGGYLVSDWYGHQDQQTEWVAGVIVHNAVHIAQYNRGAATTGPEAEMEALLKQQLVLNAVDTTISPSGQFRDYIQKVINTNNPVWFGDFQTPPGPENPF